jgi:chemotaxis protein methyltransferase CheR
MSSLIDNQNPAPAREQDLAEIRLLIEQRSGIQFDESRSRFFSARIADHLRECGVDGTAELVRLVRNSNVEYERLLQRVLTQETSFYRYPAIFEALRERVLPELRTKKLWGTPRRLRIWSAGCSTGEEPYSIGMTTLNALELPESWHIEILATDVSREALEIAERGVYSQRDLASVPPAEVDAYFSQSGPDHYCVRPKLRSLISFAQMNLAQMIYMGRFDCIFCMNVLIYFSEELRASLIRRFYDFLEPHGYLFLGHAESVAKANVSLEAIVIQDSLIYRKPAARVAEERL